MKKCEQTIFSHKNMLVEYQSFTAVLKAPRTHTAKITQNWLKVNLKEPCLREIWPPSSPSCCSLDYFMWSTIEREVNKQPHNTLAYLRAKIMEVMAYIDREVVICPCNQFCSQIEAVVEANGDFIE